MAFITVLLYQASLFLASLNIKYLRIIVATPTVNSVLARQSESLSVTVYNRFQAIP